MRILVLRRDNIGDLLCTTPLLEALRRRWPEAWIGVLANTYNAAVLARNPAVDEVFAYEKWKHRAQPLARFVAGRLRMAASLRRSRLDWVLVPAAAPQAVDYARSLRPARLVLGDSTDARHEVLRTWAVGRELGIAGEPGPMRAYPDPAVVSAMRARLAPGPRIAIHVSARRVRQRWPEERYVDLVRRQPSGTRVTLLWAPGSTADARHPGDDEKAGRILEALRGSPVDAVATRTLDELAAALTCADSVVCPDGGAMHLAAALGKPVVALFGDSPVERWRPWGVPHRVLRPDSGELADLGVDAVLSAQADLASVRGHQDPAQ